MNNDIISRQAAIEALDELCNRICEYSKKQRHTMCGACNLGSAFDVIDELPAAEPRKGNWICKPNIYGVAYCSECDYELHTNDTNYCPNCGARMEET